MAKIITIPEFTTSTPDFNVTLPGYNIKIPAFSFEIPDSNNVTKDSSRFNVRDFGGVGDGKHHSLSEKYNTLEDARLAFPGVDILSLEETQDWAAAQLACNTSRDHIRATLGAGNVLALFRTLVSFSPTVFFPAGLYVFNKPLMVYPHTSLEGVSWGHSIIKLSDKNWSVTARPMTTNPQGIFFIGPTYKSSALIWLQADEEFPVGTGLKVAGMINSITKLSFRCYDGACIYNAGNQNQIEIISCHLNGYGNGATGLGFISNNATSSSQITNLFFRNNFLEGCRAGIVLDKVEPGCISDNQVECANGFYIGHGSNLEIHHNLFTNFMKIAPFSNGIFVGLLCPGKINNNTIQNVEGTGIKVLGKDTQICNNLIILKNGFNIKKSGFGITIVTQRNGFGGDLSILGGKNGPHLISTNTISPDSWPNPIYKPIYVDVLPNENMKISLSNNIDSP